MLPLDGGHVAIAVYERIRTRRGRPYHADATKLMPVAYAFVVVLLVVVVTARSTSTSRTPSPTRSRLTPVGRPEP